MHQHPKIYLSCNTLGREAHDGRELDAVSLRLEEIEAEQDRVHAKL